MPRSQMSLSELTRQQANAWQTALLEGLGISFQSPRMIPPSDFDFEASRELQHRFGRRSGVNDDNLEHLLYLLGQGTVLPWIVGHIGPNGKVFIDAGFHRGIGHNKLKKDIETVIVADNTPEELLEEVRRVSNDYHGLPVTNDNRLAVALRYVRKDGMSMKAAATKAQIEENTLRKELEREEQEERFKKVGRPPVSPRKGSPVAPTPPSVSGGPLPIPDPPQGDPLMPTTVRTLKAIEDDDLLMALHEAVGDTSLPESQYLKYLKDLLELKGSHSAQMDYVKEVEKTCARATLIGAPPSSPSPKTPPTSARKAWGTLRKVAGMFPKLSIIDGVEDAPLFIQTLNEIEKDLLRLRREAESLLSH